MSHMVPLYGFDGGISSKFQLIVKTATGSIVTATKSGVTKNAKEKNGIWCFKGLDPGSWVITCSDGSRTATKTVDIEDGACILMEIGYRSIPEFTYTGNYEIVTDDDQPISNPDSHQGDWKIRFLTSGTLTFTELRSAENGIDVFLVGGGAGGTSHYVHAYGENRPRGGGGGDGGYSTKGTTTPGLTTYTITVGAGGAGGGTKWTDGTDEYPGKAGGSSSAFGLSASGGGAHSDGAWNGAGTSRTVYEFLGTSGKTYGNGGGSYTVAPGGTNTGNGGGGGNNSGGAAGGSGIVIIRNKR